MGDRGVVEMTRLLITGGAGFIGHHVVEGVLKETDWEVAVLDGLHYAASLDRLADTEGFKQNRNRVCFVFHDLRGPVSEATHARIGDVDLIWNLAAESHVDRSLVDAVPFVESNTLGVAHLLEYARNRQPKLRQFVQFSTDEVYGPAPDGVMWKEEDRLWPSNPYAAAKAGGDLLALSFAHSHHMPIIVTRTMNVFGERQHPEKFLAKTVRAILKGEKVLLHGVSGRGASSRCWIHARNIASALIFLTERGKSESIYNITGEERTVEQMASLACETLTGKPLQEDAIEWVDAHTARPGHDFRYALDGSKMREMGWMPPIPLNEALAKTVIWMRQHPEWLL